MKVVLTLINFCLVIMKIVAIYASSWKKPAISNSVFDILKNIIIRQIVCRRVSLKRYLHYFNKKYGKHNFCLLSVIFLNENAFWFCSFTQMNIWYTVCIPTLLIKYGAQAIFREWIGRFHSRNGASFLTKNTSFGARTRGHLYFKWNNQFKVFIYL